MKTLRCIKTKIVVNDYVIDHYSLAWSVNKE